ncbi:hypothetical protein WA026_018574 [Henosepilachna vigintioctopunctata]|uniref:Uncharacterized protein n=1 Tax=Henosepilachna vigintioctopunctata TaxID=420089 RepID=A0AAW1U0V8_9CUCU
MLGLVSIWPNQCEQRFVENTRASQLTKALNNVKSTVKKKTDVKVTGNRKKKLQPWEKTFLELIEYDNPVFHKIPGNISVDTSAELPVQQPTSDDIQESLPNTETGRKTNKNEELKSQEIKKPMNTKSDADHHKNKIRKSEEIVSNHEADGTKDLCTPQLQRIVLLQQYKLNKIKLEKETILLETMKKQTVEKSTQNHRASLAFVSQFEYNQGHQLQTANENVSATKL